MRFIDEVTVHVHAGDGGDGAVAWRREAHVPRGGPDGGAGGDGGAVIFVATSDLNTLIDFSFQPLIRAGNGAAGQNANCNGRDGENALVQVPVGTQVYYQEKLVADLSESGARWIAARGGKGGKGNHFFKSSTNQAPDYAEKGQPGERFSFRLVLKSVADVGLIGLPNVGKSTLISVISKAQPEIADYPFTTLRPHLGVVFVGDNRFVVADIPGLIPGAHQGKGLGIEFLKHIERTSVLAQLLDVTQPMQGTESDSESPNFKGLNLAGGKMADEADDEVTDKELRILIQNQFSAIETELRLFSEALLRLPRIVVFSKADFPLTKRAYELTKDDFRKKGFETFIISSVSQIGLEELKSALFRIVCGTKAVVRK